MLSPEEVSGGLAEVLPGGGLQLAHHGLHEGGEGAEVGLDGGVAEGEVGEGHHGVAAHLAARGAGPGVRRMLHLGGIFAFVFVNFFSHNLLDWFLTDTWVSKP